MLYVYLLFLLGLFLTEILYILNKISLTFIIKSNNLRNMSNYLSNKIKCYHFNYLFFPFGFYLLGDRAKSWNLLKLIININVIFGLLTIFYRVLILDISLIDNIINKREYLNINSDNNSINVNNNDLKVNNPNLTLNTPTL